MNEYHYKVRDNSRMHLIPTVIPIGEAYPYEINDFERNTP